MGIDWLKQIGERRAPARGAAGVPALRHGLDVARVGHRAAAPGRGRVAARQGMAPSPPLPQPPERSLRAASVPASAIGSRWRVSDFLARFRRGRPSTAPIPPRTATSSAESPDRNSRIARCAVRRGIPARCRYDNHLSRSTSPSASASSAPILMKAAMDARRARVCSRQCRRVRSARPAKRSPGTGIDAAPGEHLRAHLGARALDPVRVGGARHARGAAGASSAPGGGLAVPGWSTGSGPFAPFTSGLREIRIHDDGGSHRRKPKLLPRAGGPKWR